MEIQHLQIEYFCKSGFANAASEGICHVKTLPYLSVVQAVEGSYDIRLGNGEMYHTGCAGFFIAPSAVQQTIIHHADQTSKLMTCRWIFLKIKINDTYYFDDLFDFPVILPEEDRQTLHLIFDRLFHSENIFDTYICIYEIIKVLFRNASEKNKKFPVNIRKALLYIEKHYQEKITVETLATELHLSSSYFYAVFQKTMGISPIAYLNNYRLSLAANLLLQTDNSITEICNSVVISDSIYFNKMFKKAYQMPPSQYRQIYKTSV